MKLNRFWAFTLVCSIAAVPALALMQGPAEAAGKRKAEWRTPPAKKQTTAAATPARPDPIVFPELQAAANPDASSTASAPSVDVPVQDQSQEVLDNDAAMAASILSQGPKLGYATALSDEGVLYDANGASPSGQEAANTRFASFPTDVQFVRTPEKAVAAGGSGSSWGTYTIKRGETVLSAGRYISVWRREASGWKMISELAAGKNAAPPAAASPGALPKRPAQLGRAPRAPIGVPLTVPTAQPAAPENATSESETQPKR